MKVKKITKKVVDTSNPIRRLIYRRGSIRMQGGKITVERSGKKDKEVKTVREAWLLVTGGKLASKSARASTANDGLPSGS